MSNTMEETALEEIKNTNPTAFKILNDFYQENKAMTPFVKGVDNGGCIQYSEVINNSVKITVDGIDIMKVLCESFDESPNIKDVKLVYGDIVLNLPNSYILSLSNNCVVFGADQMEVGNE